MIRTARHGETALLSDLAFRSKAHWGYSDEFMDLCRDELTISTDYLSEHASFVLEAGGAVVGFGTLERLSDSRVELGHLFVDPPLIGRGYGSELMIHIVEAARSEGYLVLEILADPSAERFYLSSGGRRVGLKASASIPGRELPLLEVEL